MGPFIAPFRPFLPTLPRSCSLSSQGFQKKNLLLAQIKGGCKFIEVYVKLVLPYFGKHFDLWKENILVLIKELQYCTRCLQNISSWGKRNNELSVVKETPKLKKVLEIFIYQVKGLMKANHVVSAIYNANLKARNIDGSEYKDDDDDDSSSSESESDSSSDDDDDDDEGAEEGGGD